MKYINICDQCADNIGVVKEVFKTGGCTCDICGFSYPCTSGPEKYTVSRTPAHLIPDQGWNWIEWKIREKVDVYKKY